MPPAVRFLADEDFNNDLLRALRRRRPQADVVRVQDVGLSGRPDPDVLARLGAGEAMPGVLVAPQAAAPGAVVDDLELIDAAGEPDDWAGRVIFLPLR